jgi:hypothetical protein
MGDIRLPNTKFRKFMVCMNIIVDVCIVHKMIHSMLYYCVAHYPFEMHVVTIPSGSARLELECFENDSHHFINLWFKLYGLGGCTNYTHVLMTHLIFICARFYVSITTRNKGGRPEIRLLLPSFSRTRRGEVF